MFDLLQEAGYTPKKKASTHGGEYCSPCPFCKDGNDRFLIWPNRHNNNGEYQGGRYTCRVCGKYGDAINFIRELYGLSYDEACVRLKIDPKKRNVTFVTKREIKPPIANDPSELWKDKAIAFIEWCNSQLIANQTALTFVKNRGFTIESINRFKIGFNPKDLWRPREDWGLDNQTKEDGTNKKLWLPHGMTIPTFSNDQIIKIKVRRSVWKEGDELPKYVEISGSKPCLSIYGDSALKVAIILESELDSLLIQQEAGDLVYCIALGGSTKSLDFHTDQLLRRTPILLFCPDFDKAGAAAWVKWKKMFPAIQCILTPDGKSAGDAYLAGVNLREWLIDSLQSIQRNELRRKERLHIA